MVSDDVTKKLREIESEATYALRLSSSDDEDDLRAKVVTLRERLNAAGKVNGLIKRSNMVLVKKLRKFEEDYVRVLGKLSTTAKADALPDGQGLIQKLQSELATLRQEKKDTQKKVSGLERKNASLEQMLREKPVGITTQPKPKKTDVESAPAKTGTGRKIQINQETNLPEYVANNPFSIAVFQAVHELAGFSDYRRFKDYYPAAFSQQEVGSSTFESVIKTGKAPRSFSDRKTLAEMLKLSPADFSELDFKAGKQKKDGVEINQETKLPTYVTGGEFSELLIRRMHELSQAEDFFTIAGYHRFFFSDNAVSSGVLRYAIKNGTLPKKHKDRETLVQRLKLSPEESAKLLKAVPLATNPKGGRWVKINEETMLPSYVGNNPLSIAAFQAVHRLSGFSEFKSFNDYYSFAFNNEEISVLSFKSVIKKGKIPRRIEDRNTLLSRLNMSDEEFGSTRRVKDKPVPKERVIEINLQTGLPAYVTGGKLSEAVMRKAMELAGSNEPLAFVDSYHAFCPNNEISDYVFRNMIKSGTLPRRLADRQTLVSRLGLSEEEFGTLIGQPTEGLTIKQEVPVEVDQKGYPINLAKVIHARVVYDVAVSSNDGKPLSVSKAAESLGKKAGLDVETLRNVMLHGKAISPRLYEKIRNYASKL